MDFLKTLFKQARELLALSALPAESVSGGSLGVDIGSDSVKIVRLASAKDGLRVIGFCVQKAGERNYLEALNRGLSAAGAAPGQPAVVSVSGQGVVSRYVEFPMMNKSELESTMKFEMEKYVPFSLAEVVSDWTVISQLKDRAKSLLLIAAAKNEVVQKKINLAQEVNMRLGAIDLDGLALANFFNELIRPQACAACCGIINIGRSVSNIDIMVEGVPYLSRDIFIGGDDFTRKISEQLELDYGEAERLKFEPKTHESEILGILDPVLNNLAAEIRVSLDYFEARNNRVVEKMFIAGGSSRLCGLEGYLNHLLSIEVRKADYCSALKFEAAVSQDEFRKNSDLLAIAMGLALR